MAIHHGSAEDIGVLFELFPQLPDTEVSFSHIDVVEDHDSNVLSFGSQVS